MLSTKHPRRAAPRRGVLMMAVTALVAAVSVAGTSPAAAEQVPTVATGTAGTAGTAVRWTAAWGAGQQGLTDVTTAAGTTLRLLVNPSVSGTAVRIRLANTFGTQTLRIAGASVGVAEAIGRPALAATPGRGRRVTFHGTGRVGIPAGGRVLSDPVALPVRRGQTLAVDLYLAEAPSGPVTGHLNAQQGSFTAAGDHRGEVAATAFAGQLYSWYYLDGVDVLPAPAARGAVVALGDSINEGAYSTYNGGRRWTDVLSARLAARSGAQHGVVNSGIGGNRVLAYRGDCCGTSESALVRLDRDVLQQTGVRTVIIAEGVNDLGYHATAAELVTGLTALVTRSRAAGLRVVLATITPYGCDTGCLGADQEADRQAVNTWIRGGGAADAVADFDAAVRDPEHPDRLGAAYDAGDHLHLGDAGYAALGAAVPLAALG